MGYWRLDGKTFVKRNTNMKKLAVVFLAALLSPLAWAANEAAAPGMPTLKGEVLEVLDVDAYTYLRLKTANGEVWARRQQVARCEEGRRRDDPRPRDDGELREQGAEAHVPGDRVRHARRRHCERPGAGDRGSESP